MTLPRDKNNFFAGNDALHNFIIATYILLIIHSGVWAKPISYYKICETECVQGREKILRTFQSPEMDILLEVH